MDASFHDRQNGYAPFRTMGYDLTGLIADAASVDGSSRHSLSGSPQLSRKFSIPSNLGVRGRWDSDSQVDHMRLMDEWAHDPPEPLVSSLGPRPPARIVTHDLGSQIHGTSGGPSSSTHFGPRRATTERGSHARFPTWSGSDPCTASTTNSSGSTEPATSRSRPSRNNRSTIVRPPTPPSPRATRTTPPPSRTNPAPARSWCPPPRRTKHRPQLIFQIRHSFASLALQHAHLARRGSVSALNQDATVGSQYHQRAFGGAGDPLLSIASGWTAGVQNALGPGKVPAAAAGAAGFGSAAAVYAAPRTSAV
ncbi:hypothetical protein DFJ73DRAFT_86157 [Zopfochytrium polystomum]|nr:hypothetical protein DFJ73DRAFT_86157 [Zopfochytrium polystomum]